MLLLLQSFLLPAVGNVLRSSIGVHLSSDVRFRTHSVAHLCRLLFLDGVVETVWIG